MTVLVSPRERGFHQREAGTRAADLRQARGPAKVGGADGLGNRVPLHGRELEACDNPSVSFEYELADLVLGDVLGDHRAQLVLVLVPVDAGERRSECLMI